MFTRIGLTGGIGAGKSTLAAHFEERGAFVIDYDELSAKVTSRGSEALGRIVDEFGPEAIAKDGSFNRPWIAEQIFRDPALRDKLNSIIHPSVFALAANAENAWLEHPTHVYPDWKVVVHDIPLLVESGQKDYFDVIIDVEAPPRVRMHRLVRTRGLSLAQAASRIDAQASSQSRRDVAHYVIDSTQSIEQMFDYADRILKTIYTDMRVNQTAS